MLSIIIPTLNEEKYLPELLTSIREQNFSDYEIIISDASSEDRTQEIAETFACRLVVSAKDARHPSIQRNAGAKIAQGDILLFLDADTRIEGQDFLEKVVEEFKARNLAIAGFYLTFNSKKFFYKFFRAFYNFFAFLAQYVKPLALGAGIIVLKKCHEKAGGFDESIYIGEDQAYCEKLKKFGRFRILKSKKIIFSNRRFEKNGCWKMFRRIMYSTFYVLLFGPIKKKIIEYDFGEW